MFKYKQTSQGTVKYYVTKDGRPIRLDPTRAPAPDPFDWPGTRPLVNEKEVKKVLYQLFDRSAVGIVGVYHGHDVRYLNIRKSRESVRALSRLVGRAHEMPPGATELDEAFLDDPDLRRLMSREDVAWALHGLYRPTSPTSPSRRRHKQPGGSPGKAVSTAQTAGLSKTGTAQGLEGAVVVPWSAATYASRQTVGTAASTAAPSLHPSTASSSWHHPALPPLLAQLAMASHAEDGGPAALRAFFPGREEVEVLRAQVGAVEARLRVEASKLAGPQLDVRARAQRVRKRLALGLMFRTLGRAWANARTARAVGLWLDLVEEQREAERALKAREAEVLCIQRTFRGLRGRQRYRRWKLVRESPVDMSKGLERMRLRRAWRQMLAFCRGETEALHRRGRAALRIQACWRGFRHGRCPVRYMRCKILLQSLREVGGGHLFRLHKVSLGKKDRGELARILDMALTPLKPLRQLPTQQAIRQSGAAVERLVKKLEAERCKRQAGAPSAEAPPPSQPAQREGVEGGVHGKPGAKAAQIVKRKLSVDPRMVTADEGDEHRVRQLKGEKAAKDEARREAAARARECELMRYEDLRGTKVEASAREERERAEREEKEKERLRGRGSVQRAPHLSAPAPAPKMPQMVWQDFKVGEHEWVAGLWLQQGSWGAAHREHAWILRTSQQLLIERRRKWFAAIARTAQAVRVHEAAVKSLRRLKVKLTIERREKEAEVAAVKTELDLAVAAEKGAAKDLRSVLTTFIKAVCSAFKVKAPRFELGAEDLKPVMAAVEDWAAAESARFVETRRFLYVEALQRFEYLNNTEGWAVGEVEESEVHLTAMDPTDPRWIVEAAKAKALDILDAISHTFALQFKIVEKLEDGSHGAEVYSTVLEEDAIMQLIGRRGFSEYLRQKDGMELMSGTRRRLLGATSGGGLAGHGTGVKQQVRPTRTELRELQQLLSALTGLVEVDGEGAAVKLGAIPKRCLNVEVGPVYEWRLNGYKCRLRPFGTHEVGLAVTDLAKGETRMVTLPNEMTGTALTGFALSTDACKNCVERPAAYACQRQRHLCEPCMRLLRSEKHARELPPHVEVRRVLGRYIEQAFHKKERSMGLSARSRPSSPVSTLRSAPTSPVAAAMRETGLASTRDRSVRSRSPTTLRSGPGGAGLDSTLLELGATRAVLGTVREGNAGLLKISMPASPGAVLTVRDTLRPTMDGDKDAHQTEAREEQEVTAA